MKKILLLVSLFTFSASFTACDSALKTDPKMDTIEATQTVVEALKNSINFDDWKLYGVEWGEGETLENELNIATIHIVNKDGKCFRQWLYLTGPSKGTAGKLNEDLMAKADFEKTVGINPDSIDPAVIQQQYEAAIATVPEGYTFKSINRYEIEESVPSKVSFSDRDKTMGEIKSFFIINITEDGKEVIQNAGEEVYQYYEITFDVQPDGSIEMREK